MFEELEQIRGKCLKCEKCGLCKTRTNVVFSDGVPNNKLMLVGEAPGYWEDIKGKPFVGKRDNYWIRFLAVQDYPEKKTYIFATL